MAFNYRDLSHWHKPYRYSLTACLAIVLLLVVSLVGWQVYKMRLSPVYPVYDVQFSNLTDQLATVSWKTAQPTVGGVRFLGERRIFGETDSKAKRVHMVTITQLKPQTAYSAYVTNSFGRQIRSFTFKTPPIPPQIKIPSPVYGKVLDQNGKPVTGALVFLRRVFVDTTPQVQTEPVSALTNASGNYLLDLNNSFFVDNTTNAFSAERLKITVWWPDGTMKENLLTQNQIQPIPDIRP